MQQEAKTIGSLASEFSVGVLDRAVHRVPY
jgi:hypothetical protein